MRNRTTIQHRRGTKAEWVAANPVLAFGEVGVESDGSSIRQKTGDGKTRWNDLPHGGGSDPEIASWVEDAGTDTSAALTRNFLSRSINKTTDDGHGLLHAVDKSVNPHDTIRIDDSPGHTADIINLSHFGTSPNGEQAYAINIANNPGASGGFIMHQYSRVQPAIQLDNTDIASTIFIRNTQNQTMNPGGQGTGPFLQFMPYGQTKSLFFTDGLQWINNTSKDMLFRAMNPSVYGLGVQVDTDKTGLQVMKNGTGAGAALSVTNKGTGAGISIVQNGAGDGMRVIQLNSGSYAARYEGQNYGISAIVTGDGGIAFDITKSGTGNGTALRVANKGTGDILAGTNGSTNTYKIKFNGETEQFANGVGHVMRSPDGTRYRLTMSNAGELTITPA